MVCPAWIYCEVQLMDRLWEARIVFVYSSRQLFMCLFAISFLICMDTLLATRYYPLLFLATNTYNCQIIWWTTRGMWEHLEIWRW